MSLLISLENSMDSESELISLISCLLFSPASRTVIWNSYCTFYFGHEAQSLIIRIISMVSSVDLNSQPKPESEFMSLITQAISVFSSMDFDSQPAQLQNFISYFSQKISGANSANSNSNRKPLDPNFEKILTLEPEPELVSLIYQILCLVTPIKSKFEKVISLCPQFLVTLKNGKFHVLKRKPKSMFLDICGKWACLPWFWFNLRLSGEDDATHFCCEGCKGKNHEEYKKAPVEIKHHLHLKHSLQLVLLEEFSDKRQCYCCDEALERIFYYCSACDFAIKFSCVKKPRVLSIDYPKWHEHTLQLFPRHASLTCNLCALADASSPLYMCPNCDFVAHLRCINLPLVIRISRHHHRISFTPSLYHGDTSCGVCRKAMDNDYGSYSCIKDGCSYAAHSRCATQINVWDGKELEGEPEEEEEDIEEVEPFVRIGDGIIQHFSHQHHHLRLDENMGRDYDENKKCHACITPIYFGNFYSCMQCDFILHQECANLSRKIYHPIHPHMLTLGYGNVKDRKDCTTCQSVCIAGFFYKCSKERFDFALQCHNFTLHVQCATISEPLVHESHIHPLFLTSKPGDERRLCSVCRENRRYGETIETFNCIEECDFALCFGCATLPHKVRYKHDKHVLTLSYGKKTSTKTYWCEVCERKVDPKQRFYVCDEYCCVTLHIECLLGKDLYMNPGLSFVRSSGMVQVLANNQHMTRPICSICKQRCPHKIFFQLSGSISCSLFCLDKLDRRRYLRDRRQYLRA